jgi:hypothetical protein
MNRDPHIFVTPAQPAELPNVAFEFAPLFMDRPGLKSNHSTQEDQVAFLAIDLCEKKFSQRLLAGHRHSSSHLGKAAHGGLLVVENFENGVQLGDQEKVFHPVGQVR